MPPTKGRVYELASVVSDVIIAGAKVSASGSASFQVAPAGGSGQDWLVLCVVATVGASGAASSATAAQATLYTDSVAQGNLWDQTAVGLAVAAVGFYSPPRRLKANQILIATFTGCGSGDFAQIRCEYALDDSGRC